MAVPLDEREASRVVRTGRSRQCPSSSLAQPFPSDTLFARQATPGEPFHLAWDGQIPNSLDPQAMLTQILEDPSVAPTFDDRGYRRRLAAAARLSGPERYLTYGRLDLDLARNAAPLAAFGNLSSHDFFSMRIGCQTFGIYDMYLAALCCKHRQP